MSEEAGLQPDKVPWSLRRRKRQLYEKGLRAYGAPTAASPLSRRIASTMPMVAAASKDQQSGMQPEFTDERQSAGCSNGSSWAAAAGRWQLGGGGAARLCSPSFRARTNRHYRTPRSSKSQGESAPAAELVFGAVGAEMVWAWRLGTCRKLKAAAGTAGRCARSAKWGSAGHRSAARKTLAPMRPPARLTTFKTATADVRVIT